VIRSLLKDSNVTIREAALEAVGHWQDAFSADTVRWMCYHDANPFVRPQAISTLVSLLGREALPDLLALAGDLNVHVRQKVAFQLGQLDDLPPEAEMVLRRLAADPETAESAAWAVQKHQISPEPQDAPLPDLLLNSLPLAIQGEAPALLARLEAWQSDLSSLAGTLPLDDLAQLDQALCTLIMALRRSTRP
jgi:HEAT repeat protein